LQILIRCNELSVERFESDTVDDQCRLWVSRVLRLDRIQGMHLNRLNKLEALSKTQFDRLEKINTFLGSRWRRFWAGVLFLLM